MDAQELRPSIEDERVTEARMFTALSARANAARRAQLAVQMGDAVQVRQLRPVRQILAVR